MDKPPPLHISPFNLVEHANVTVRSPPRIYKMWETPKMGDNIWLKPPTSPPPTVQTSAT